MKPCGDCGRKRCQAHYWIRVVDGPWVELLRVAVDQDDANAAAVAAAEDCRRARLAKGGPDGLCPACRGRFSTTADGMMYRHAKPPLYESACRGTDEPALPPEFADGGANL